MPRSSCRLDRSINTLAEQPFDVLVIGGGVLGACIARDSALRGLRTALIEAEDFAAGTSWNSLKIIHGGLRYLQHLDLGRMRDSIRERSTWLRIAPHLVTPLPVLIPTYGYGMRGRAALRAALAVNDLMSWDRNRALPPDHSIPPGRALSGAETVSLVPEAERSGLTGGILFHDAQVYSAERLVLAVVAAAAAAGAVVVNHVSFVTPVRQGGRLAAVRAEDRLTGIFFDVRTRCVVNAAGAATDAVASRLLGRDARPASPSSVAVNIVLRRGLGHRVAFAVSEAAGHAWGAPRQFFVVPWRGQTAVGTGHYPYHGDPADFRTPVAAVEAFLEEIRQALPTADIAPSELAVVHGGILPSERRRDLKEVSVRRHPVILDHALDGCPEAVTAVSVKYTTARSVAQRVVNLLFRKLGHRPPACSTATTPLPGTPHVAMADLLRSLRQGAGPAIPDDVLEHLAHAHGTDARHLLASIHARPALGYRVHPAAPVVHAQLQYARDHEMALTVDDLLQRRTELGPRGLVNETARKAAETALADRGPAPGADADPTSVPDFRTSR